MNLLHANINANLRILINAWMELDHSKLIVIRLAGKVIHDIVEMDDVIKVVYSDFGLRGSMKFKKVLAPVLEMVI